jgi:hypothetical protein
MDNVTFEASIVPVPEKVEVPDVFESMLNVVFEVNVTVNASIEASLSFKSCMFIFVGSVPNAVNLAVQSV